MHRHQVVQQPALAQDRATTPKLGKEAREDDQIDPKYVRGNVSSPELGDMHGVTPFGYARYLRAKMSRAG